MIVKTQVDMVAVLRRHAETRGSTVAFAATNGDEELARITYQELDQSAVELAVAFESHGLSRKPALLLFDSGLDFIRAFFGCLYAQTLAVPVNLPTQRQRIDRLRAVAESSGAAAVITTTALAGELAKRGLNLNCIAVDTVPLSGTDWARWRPQAMTLDRPAFLQYTSGSTGAPKGVMVTHGNLMSNQAMIKRAFGHGDHTVFAGWLPLFHDMGLVGNVLQSVYLGIPCAIMTPGAFVQKPLRWLQMVSRYGATTSGAPNFAYDLCVRRIQDAELTDLDLSSWEVAFNGAEPIRAETLQRFCDRFRRCGFSERAFYPCYGMAEATLFVTGGVHDQAPTVRTFDDPARGLGSQRTLVGCGRPWGDESVLIVDPDTREELSAPATGELWIAGSNIAAGYWRDELATADTFGAFTRDGRGPYLRTGDLGFLEDGELFVTGRLKELLIIAGRNVYPQDLEHAAMNSHAAFQGLRGAAFQVSTSEGELAVLVQEVRRDFLTKADGNELRAAIREAILAEYAVSLNAVVLIPPAHLPMTTSGKVQRRACQKLYVEQGLREVLNAKTHA